MLWIVADQFFLTSIASTPLRVAENSDSLEYSVVLKYLNVHEEYSFSMTVVVASISVVSMPGQVLSGISPVGGVITTVPEDFPVHTLIVT